MLSLATHSHRSQVRDNADVAYSPRPSLSKTLPVFSMAVATIGLCLAIVYVCGLNLRSLLIVLNALVLMLPLVVRLWLGRLDLFEPLIMADLSMFGMYIGRPLSDILTGHFHEHAYDINPTYDSALLLVLVGNLMFQLGYFSPFGRAFVNRMPKALPLFRQRLAILWTTFISVTGLVLFSLFLSTQGGLSFLIQLATGRHAERGPDRFASSTAYIYNGVNFLVPGATLLFAVWLRTRRKIYLVLSILTFAPYMAIQIGNGGRSGIIGLLFGLPLMWYMYHGKRPRFIVLVAGGLTLAFFFSFLREYRNVEVRGQHQISEYVNKPVETITQLFSSDDDEMFDVVAQTISVTPYWVPFRHFGIITDILVRSVPRTLWLNKPTEMGEVFFATMEPGRYAHARAGTALSLMGDFYLDSGVTTVVIWMFIMGIVLRSVWEWMLDNSRSMVVLMIYSTVPGAVLGTWRGNLAGYFGLAFFTAFPLVLFAYLQHFQSRPLPRLLTRH